MGLFIYILFTITISFLFIKFSKYIASLFKLFIILFSLILFIQMFPILTKGLYRINSDNFYFRLYNKADYSTIYQNMAQNTIKYVLVKYNDEYYKLYGFSNKKIKGYVLKIDGVYKISLLDEIKIKLFLTFPLFLIIIVLFIEDDFFVDWTKMKKNMKEIKSYIYMDHTIISELNKLKIDIEKIKTRRKEFELLKEKIEKLKEKTVERELMDRINAMEDELEKLEDKGMVSNFKQHLSQCTNFIEECLLRIDYEDYEVAIDIFKRNVEKILREKTDNNKDDFHTIVNIAFSSKLIDFELKDKLHWLEHLRRDFYLKEQTVFVNIAKLKQTIKESEILL